MSRQDEIKKIIGFHNRRLEALEKKQAFDGAETLPEVLVEIDDIKSQITALEAELKEPDVVDPQEPPPEIKEVYDKIEDGLDTLDRTIDKLSSELDTVSEKARPGAKQLLAQARQRFLALDQTRRGINLQAEAAEEALKNLLADSSNVKSSLHPLILRSNYQKRFGLLKEKLAREQFALTEEQLQTMVQPQLDQIEDQIRTLEGKADLSPNDDQLLVIYRRNADLYRQIMAGERLYAPLNLLNEIIDLEQHLEKIDTELAT